MAERAVMSTLRCAYLPPDGSTRQRVIARERLAWAFLPPPSCRGGAETPCRGSRGKPEASGRSSQDTPVSFSIRHPVCPSVSARARPLLRDLCDRAELVHLPTLLLPSPPLHPPPPPVNGAEPHRVMLLLLRPALPS
ncbi:hypothetical protein KOW79_012491 [Hemibagrus wyckioides]|uniref:Uncharacterized protein n=1 Tax=Hemibagrus wyckioides TaxID=337641 RepID=A0A9D3NLX3_9TELE|nr:hypothetical protein KOW79_012491 [Hemibagrus wyckioides]